ncbi:hypothetical protein BDV95DRAFT_64924 [Massariosphaeria phaeospora]|uniref:Uncharacterized protein n=1 Tax=Massariosphaeria phaeospora TaxID=100035 RepID=A0A7C8I9F3_9PLEO|nr:hypothetical protein BDV95DRAFT_64924 [Massariosphaeria phaeospora]
MSIMRGHELTGFFAFGEWQCEYKHHSFEGNSHRHQGGKYKCMSLSTRKHYHSNNKSAFSIVQLTETRNQDPPDPPQSARANMQFNTVSIATLLALTASTTAWSAGFWSTDGRNLQVHGKLWECNTIQALPLGQVTFDTRTKDFPDPTTICIFSKVDCKGTILYCGGHSLEGRQVTNPGVAKSYKVGLA